MLGHYPSSAISMQQEPIASLSVSEFSQKLQKNLEESFPQVWVTGELSGIFKAQSGHVYATLKDSHAQLKIVIYQYVISKVVFNLEEGLQVKLLATPTLYKPRGDFQLLVKAIEPDGQGPLKLAFDQIKAKLTAEGLFNIEHKKSFPRYPKAIGLITSTGGAVLHDIMRVLMRRYPVVRVHVYPTAVQGKEANAQIIKALEKAAQENVCDAYILARGGGSLEDLWCFNTEEVIRAIYAFPYPIISAIGHETDFTLADLVADLRAATPSVAAELIVPDLKELYLFLHNIEAKFVRSMSTLLRTHEQRIDYLIRLFKNPELLLERFYLVIKLNEQKIHQFINRSIQGLEQKIILIEQRALSCLSKYNKDLLIHEHKVKTLLKQMALSVDYRWTLIQQRLDFIQFKLQHLDPVKKQQLELNVKTQEGIPLTSAQAIQPHTKAYLAFPDGSWEIEFIKLLEAT